MTTAIEAFFAERVPVAWFQRPIDALFDDEEILCVGVLPDGVGVDEFRERTRAERMAIASDAETRFSRKVSWGVLRDGATTLFTNVSAPVTTRLRLSERKVLDTLVDAGVARSRSDALSWCVKLVGRHQADWLAELREALVGVQDARSVGPRLL